MKDSSIDKLYFKKKKKIEAIYLSFISNLKKRNYFDENKSPFIFHRSHIFFS